MVGERSRKAGSPLCPEGDRILSAQVPHECVVNSSTCHFLECQTCFWGKHGEEWVSLEGVRLRQLHWRHQLYIKDHWCLEGCWEVQREGEGCCQGCAALARGCEATARSLPGCSEAWISSSWPRVAPVPPNYLFRPWNPGDCLQVAQWRQLWSCEEACAEACLPAQQREPCGDPEPAD